MKVCADCKYFVHNGPVGMAAFTDPGRGPPPECRHPEAGTRDPVFGKTLCENERNSKGRNSCGKQGRLWTPK